MGHARGWGRGRVDVSGTYSDALLFASSVLLVVDLISFLCRFFQVGEFGGMEGPSSGGDAPSSKAKEPKRSPSHRSMSIFNHSSFVGTNVSNRPGGSIVVDQQALSTWSIDAMRVIRDQLYRAAGSNEGELPFVENWPREKRHFRDGVDYGSEEFLRELDLPLWAQEISSTTTDANVINASGYAAAAAAEPANPARSNNHSSRLIISDLSSMSNEVSALLRQIEGVLERQSARRLRLLRPLSRLRRNWYLLAVGLPASAYVLHKLTKEHGGFYLLKLCFTKVMDIYRDHVSEPLNSIYQEIFTKSGRIDVTDRKARADAIESLKRMIQSWLEEYFPEMPSEEKMERAEVSCLVSVIWFSWFHQTHLH